FFEHESCGKCTPCREGTKRMHEMVKRIKEGHGAVGDLDLMERLGTVMTKACLCGLGQAAPSPALTTMKHFKADYAAKFN
ncbi:MAG: NADH-ubiquinone oxidoreductase-F iron-sulfur binding region domain-containing protein, partial [Syntrophomonadaceae bacterium]|nr:NADH-ubiquinone oxidoreductase-F iron-sulfur binding region domain-containing protein [Syntrophomonadaceae bacterium]